MMLEERAKMLLPISAAARELGTTELNVLVRIKQGLLRGEEVGGVWHVPAADLADPRREERPSPPVPSCAARGCGGCGCTVDGQGARD